MLNFIDNLLNRITMYRLMLYYLLVLAGAAVIFCWLGIMPYSTLDLIKSIVVLAVVSLITNKIFAWILKIPTNAESDYITALILALIITPGSSLQFLVLAAVLAQASKYILNFRGKHIFNPAAVAVVATIFIIGQGASWWIGDVHILLFVVIGGLLVARKIQRFHLILTFLVANLLTLVMFSSSTDAWLIIRTSLVNSSLLFFAFVMLTEPLTSPPTKKLRMIYGAIVGVLAGLSFNIGPIFASPELALALGNIFSFIVSPKQRLKMVLKSKSEIGRGIYSFVFESNHKFIFLSGQYLEWTLPIKNSDTRGNRRFFTIASSPTESEVQLGVKFYDQSSSFKQKLQSLKIGDRVLAGQLTGDFTLPEDQSQKLVFIAGGIGITPFRSMLKYLIDKNEKRPITLFYSNRTEDEISYQDVLASASEKLGIKTVLVVTEKHGRISSDLIQREVPDFASQMYYISGSRSMVVAFEHILKQMGIPSSQIKIDFFPGYV